MKRGARRFHKVRSVAAATALVFVVGACGGVEEPQQASQLSDNPSSSPQSMPNLPDDLQEVELPIADGAFGSDQIVLTEDSPSVVHVANADDTAYRFRVEPGLVQATDIPAGATTDVQLTNPTANTFRGELLAAEGDEPLDTVEVVVQTVGGERPEEPTDGSDLP